MKILETVDESPSKKNMKVELSAEDVEKEVQSLYDEIDKTAVIPGFRPGKAPRQLLENRFGKMVSEDASIQAVKNATVKILEDLSVNIIGEPESRVIEEDEEDESRPEGAIRFSLKVEYLPEFDVENFENLEVEIPKTEVTDENVEQTMERFRQQMAVMVPLEEDRGIEAGDEVHLAMDLVCDEEVLQDSSEDYVFRMGETPHLPGFDDQILGMKQGEKKEFQLQFPENYNREDFRGKTADVKVEVKEIRTLRLPEVDDELAKDLGEYETLDDFRKDLRSRLEEQVAQSRERMIESAIKAKLREMNPVDAPESMVKAEYDFINRMQEVEMGRMGVSFEDYADQKDQMLTENWERAQRNVQERLILQKVAEKKGIKVGQSDLLDYLEEYALQRNMDPDKYIKEVQKRKMDDYYMVQLLESKALEAVKETTDVKEVETEEKSIEEAEPAAEQKEE